MDINANNLKLQLLEHVEDYKTLMPVYCTIPAASDESLPVSDLVTIHAMKKM